MTRMTGPDCVVMCNLINTYIHTYILLRQGSVTGVILVGRPDSLGFHSVT